MISTVLLIVLSQTSRTVDRELGALRASQQRERLASFPDSSWTCAQQERAYAANHGGAETRHLEGCRAALIRRRAYDEAFSHYGARIGPYVDTGDINTDGWCRPAIRAYVGSPTAAGRARIISTCGERWLVEYEGALQNDKERQRLELAAQAERQEEEAAKERRERDRKAELMARVKNPRVAGPAISFIVCQNEADRRTAKAGIAEDLKYAREGGGVVDKKDIFDRQEMMRNADNANRYWRSVLGKLRARGLSCGHETIRAISRCWNPDERGATQSCGEGLMAEILATLPKANDVTPPIAADDAEWFGQALGQAD